MAKKHSSGQIVVEYILLLAIAVSIAFLITTQLVSRNPESPGFLIVKWRAIIQTIGGDYAGHPDENEE